MFSAQKQVGITASTDSLLSGPGKVVGSIEDFRHRLEHITITEIDEAQETLKTLKAHLWRIQTVLEQVKTIHQRLSNVLAAETHIDASAIDIAFSDIRQTPFTVEAVAVAHNLIRFPHMRHSVHGENSSEDQSPADDESQRNGVSESADSLIPHPQGETDPERAIFVLDNPASGEETSANPSAHQSEQSNEPESANRDETAAAAGQSSKIDSRITQPEPTSASEPKPRLSYEFDQRLLNDLINDYGEFVIPSSSSPRSDPEPLQRTPEFPLVENVTAQNNVPTKVHEGDLDRKLKKLMKDYGEYDLYSGRSPKRLRTTVIAAFALLGLLFAGIYYFSPSKYSSPTDSAPAAQTESLPKDNEPLNKREPDVRHEFSDPGAAAPQENENTGPRRPATKPSGNVRENTTEKAGE